MKTNLVKFLTGFTLTVEEFISEWPLLKVSVLSFYLYFPPEMFCKKGVFNNFGKLTEKHLCWGLFEPRDSLQN